MACLAGWLRHASFLRAGHSDARWLAARLLLAAHRPASQHFSVQQQAVFHTAGKKPRSAAVRRPNCQDSSMEVLKDAASTGWVSFSQQVRLNELSGPHDPTWHSSAASGATGDTVLWEILLSLIAIPLRTNRNGFVLHLRVPPLWPCLHPQHPLISAPSFAGHCCVHGSPPTSAQARHPVRQPATWPAYIL